MSTRLPVSQDFGLKPQKLKIVVGIVLAAMISAFGVAVVTLPAQAATVSATLSPAQGATGWNTQTLTFSMTTQTAWTSYSTAVPGGGTVSIESNYSIDFIPTSPCANGVCPGVALSVTNPDTTPLATPNAKLSDYTAAFGVSLGTDAGGSPITVPAGTTFTFTFDPHTVYFRSAASKYQMVINTYVGGVPYAIVDQSAWATVFNSVSYHTNYPTDVTVLQGGLGVSALTYVPTRTGYVFQGWSLTSSGSIAYASNANFDFSSATNTPLYAIWAVAPNQTVTFNANDGSGSPATSTQTRNTSGALTSNTFTRTGFTFAGWTANQNGTGTSYSNGATYAFTSSTTLYAKWTGLSNTVTYDTHGGSAVGSSSFLSGGTIATLPAAPTLAGYTFAGWFAAASGGSALANGYAPTEVTAITLHAQWTGSVNTITFNTHGGSAVTDSSFVTGGTIATFPTAPTRSGYTFDGWFLAASGGSPLANGYAPTATGAITLHAQWTLASATVTFVANGGSGATAAQTSASAANLTANGFTRSGYYFDGWDTQANGNGTDYANSASYPFSASATLYAQWRAIPAEPTAAAVIQVPVGSSIDNAPVALSADGLLDQSSYTVTVRSTPQIIDQGTIWSGRLNTTVRLPAGLEAGWHRLIIEGTAADGTPWVETNYFEVAPGGILMATSDSDPTALVNTGTNAPSIAPIGILFVLIGAGFIAMNLWMRRRQKL